MNATAVGNGLRPFEVRLPSGCIQETDANYRGDLVSGVLNNTMDGDQCCQLCRSVPTTLQGYLYPQPDAHRKGLCRIWHSLHMPASAVTWVIPGIASHCIGYMQAPAASDGAMFCRSSKGCNVWVWCPLTSGCQTGSGSFPYLGCQLKHQAYVSTSAAPQPLPSAWSRGPPTAFVSGQSSPHADHRARLLCFLSMS